MNSFINTLVANIVNNKTGTHCRLCLRELEDENRIEFDALISNEPMEGNFEDVRSIITEMFDGQVSDDISALDSVCKTCVENLAKSYTFISTVKYANSFLSNVLENLSDFLDNINFIDFKDNQKLYVTVDECDTKGELVEIEEKPVVSKLPCSQCENTFENLHELEDHCKLFHKTYECDKCHDIFDLKKDLRSHIKTMHEIVYQYECSKCSKYFNTETSLNTHKYKFHSKECMCEFCGKVCNSKEQLKIHENYYCAMICPKCNKLYHTRTFFEKHKTLCIAGKLDTQPFRSKLKRDFVCGICGKSYSTSGGLRVHERFVHENADPHICPHCGKQFTAPSYLKVHLVKHTRERNFKCELCSKKFVSKEALLYHNRRHTGEKPYSCSYCKEKFVNSSVRAEHIKFKHIGPTLMCEICSQKFVTKFFLEKHLKKHYDPTSKLYTRYGPANVPSAENRRFIR